MVTDYKYIEDLLERFFNGETSNEEEQQLYAYFSQHDIPEHLMRYKPVFGYFENELEEELKAVEPTQSTEYTEKKKAKRRWMNVAVGIAASLLVMLMLYPLFLDKKDMFNPYEGSYIVRNGVRISDISVIKPELDATIQRAIEEEERNNRLLMCLEKPEKQSARIEQQIEEQQEDIVNHFPKEMQQEIRSIIEIK